MNRTRVIVLILVVVLLAAATISLEARPATPNVVPAYLEWGMPHGATARLECGNGFFQVITQTVSLVEVSCQPWVLTPGD